MLGSSDKLPVIKRRVYESVDYRSLPYNIRQKSTKNIDEVKGLIKEIKYITQFLTHLPRPSTLKMNKFSHLLLLNNIFGYLIFTSIDAHLFDL